MITDGKTITTEEMTILMLLASAWDKLILLPEENTGQHDSIDFMRSINECQRIVSMRLVRRIHPDMFNVILNHKEPE